MGRCRLYRTVAVSYTHLYEIQIGHASDEIREAAELTFTTDVLLPFTVDMTTTMGELMNHPKTAGKMMEYLEGISQGEEPKKMCIRDRNNFVKALRKLHPEISTVIINVNDKRTSMVLGDKESVIYGKGYIEDTLCGCTFRISPKSFYQVNPCLLYTSRCV